MPESLWNVGFAISLIFTFSFCTIIARGVFKAGVEHFSSRILVISGIINTSLCSLLFLSQGIYGVIKTVTSDSICLAQIIIPLIFIAVPFRVLWNYFSIQKKPITSHKLQPCTCDRINTKIVNLCKMMSINPPEILFSSMVVSPFVFGHRSNMAVLAIPKQWLDSDEDQQYIQLLHELSHIRNHDVGFLAWSNAVLRDLRFLLILLPALIVYSLVLNYNHMVSSIVLYLACSLILFAMLRYIVRKRESLADLTTALLVDSGKVKGVLTTNDVVISDMNIGQQPEARFIGKAQRWLSDKAMFSKKRKLWNFLLKIFNFFYSLHPTKTDRIEAITLARSLSEKAPKDSVGNSFLAGIAFGLFGVIIGLGGYWLSSFTQHPQGGNEILRLPYKMYGLAVPLALGFWVVFLTLPYWSSFRNPKLDSKFLLSQLKSYSIAFAGACLICPVILSAGISDTDIHVLTVMCATWYLFIVFFGFAISIVSIFLWITIRYLQSGQLLDLKKGFWAFAPFVIIVVSLIVIGLSMMDRQMVFEGTNLIFSTIIAIVMFLFVIGHSRFSIKDEYFILHFFGLTFLVEGEKLRWSSRFFNVVGCPVLLVALGLPVYFFISLMFADILKPLSIRSGLLFLIISSSIILVIIRVRDIRRVREVKRTKVYKLSHCLRLLSKPLSLLLCRKINNVAATYKFNKHSHSKKRDNFTVNDAYEYMQLVSDNNLQEDIKRVLSWVLECQCSQGFGLWPKSSPRLYSTYQAVSILNDKDGLDKCDNDKHIAWIKTSQQQEGYFKGPHSKREKWEDTFFAVRSLSILNASLPRDRASKCESWVQNILIKKGFEKKRPDIIYYCCGVLDGLGKLDSETRQKILDWLISKIKELLLVNVALNYESIHFVVMVYQILGTHPIKDIDNEPLALLTEKIYTALKAELADINV